MPFGRKTLMDPPIEELLDKVDSKFTLVVLGSARARQVNSYYNSLGDGLGRVVPPQVTSVSGKPLSIAFEEIAAGKATWVRVDPDAPAAPDAAVVPDPAAGSDTPAGSDGDLAGLGVVAGGEPETGDEPSTVAGGGGAKLDVVISADAGPEEAGQGDGDPSAG